MNWYVLIPIGLLLLLLIIFLVRKNIKDEKKFEEEMNNNYPHATDSPKDVETEERLH